MKKLKKILAALAAVSVFALNMPVFGTQNVSSVTFVSASAEAYTYENLSYSYLEDGTIEITGCDSSVSEIVIPNEINGTAVTSIGREAFAYNTNLTDITIPEGITIIKNSAFYYCTDLTSVTLPDGIKTIEDCAFTYCTSLESVTIPESVTNFGASLFSSTPWLAEKTQENPFVVVNGTVIYALVSGDVIIPEGVTTIGSGAFSDSNNITSVTIPDGMKEIKQNAFSFCDSLTSINIPDSVEIIEDNAFNGCTSLSKITVSDNNPSFCLEDEILFSKDKTKLIICPCTKEGTYSIPDSVNTIAGNSFESSLLTEIFIPDSVTNIGDCAFSSCPNLTNIEVSENNPSYVSIDGVLFTKDIKRLINCPGGKSGEYVVPDGVETIGLYSFSSCKKLISVTFPDSLKKIEESSFLCCYGLTDITFPEGVTDIEVFAFSGCENISTVTIPKSMKKIEMMAFYRNNKLTDVYYAGSEEEWYEIEIDILNQILTNTVIHFGETPEVTETTVTTAVSDSAPETTSSQAETSSPVSTETTTAVSESTTVTSEITTANSETTADTSGTAAITSAETTSASAVSSNTGGSLPQTGNNSLASLVKASGATLLTFAGIFTIAKSDITGRRKKEEE
ncbi:MAG: leucine-rich repeat protein [Oscillospiraceae bacterium]|nr:leucine-rich repeat protein [Oscillospiraceae bacterium]